MPSKWYSDITQKPGFEKTGTKGQIGEDFVASYYNSKPYVEYVINHTTDKEMQIKGYDLEVGTVDLLTFYIDVKNNLNNQLKFYVEEKWLFTKSPTLIAHTNPSLRIIIIYKPEDMRNIFSGGMIYQGENLMPITKSKIPDFCRVIQVPE